MLKFLKNVLLIIGIIAFVGGVVLLIMSVIDINQLAAVANSNKSGSLFPNPRNEVLLMVGATAVGCFLLGLGVGMPKKTFGQKYEEKQAEAARDLAAEARSEAPDTPDAPQH